MKPSEIRNVLEDHEVRPSKSLGQNFLTDENVARWIVEQLEIRPQDCVVEVGPGTGSLTEHAAPLCRKLVLVEFDSRLAEYQKSAGPVIPMWRFTMQTALPGTRGGCLRRPLSNSLAIFPIPRGEPSSRISCPGPVLWNVPW